ncbi:ferredoxin-dependent bilin reductase [Rubidibacter lacunae KORDI 51-2]|uniref:Phycoerythrobilin:ferredoxin oxidoreductase n=1 Tax=Rubidibacter lacunae KORDI 51-2 TaxID=582515 RepID=U5DBP3_9CHRO|nr:phycoerythrobilin:ferredoxin oxidoreductase [Rubidibacter lacunae]ERN41953.1 ferredoxin-dependent bilin reductase [Rubidibacter lacunae KORDI 51-2]
MTLYQPFLEYAIDELNRSLDLGPYPIPAGFEHKSAMTGSAKKAQEVVTTSYAYRAPKLRQIRAAHVRGGKQLQVLNFVIFPELHYDLPFFGADLVTLPGGHLIALDMQPLFRDDPAYKERYTSPIWELFQKHQVNLPWGGDFPEEAQPFFSDAFLWTRPKEDDVVKTHVFAAFKDYLQAYLKFVKAAKPVLEDCLSEVREAQLRYLRYRAAKDPARGMFQRFYGPEWTEEYIHGFLFDLERKLAVQTP